MVGSHKDFSAFGGGSLMKSEVLVERVDAALANDIASDTNLGSSVLGGSLVTYKRRKTTKVVENGRILDDSVTQFDRKLRARFLELSSRENLKHKMSNDFLAHHEAAGIDREKSEMHLSDEEDSQKRLHDPNFASYHRSLKQHRDIVLEQICQSLESESCVKKCIQNAIAFHPGSCSRTSAKESVESCETETKCTFQTEPTRDDLQNAAKSHVDMTTSESINESKHDTVTELCQRTLSDTIMSEQFAQLCSLLLDNFQVTKANKLFDLSCISSRMKDKVYETSPVLFHSDAQQIWMKLQKVGTKMIALAKCLSDQTTVSFREQVGSSAHSISEDGKHEFVTQESDMHTKSDFPKICAFNEAHTCCSHCGDKADGKNALVCDSCEEMYHISCVQPPVKDIPVKSWYCANCSTNGMESPHVNCIACERLNASREVELVHEEASEELESSNELVAKKGNEQFPDCKACRTEVKNDEDYRICGHSLCPQKIYHVQCLKNNELISYGSCWYCPSCLCRACLTDQDDDNIVLCDGCDHAYHIYCMQPPRISIPKGKWFCKNCDFGIQKIRRAKNSYQDMLSKSKRRILNGKFKGEDGLNKSGGVDMLLNAAKTLNYEDNLAVMGLQTN